MLNIVQRFLSHIIGADVPNDYNALFNQTVDDHDNNVDSPQSLMHFGLSQASQLSEHLAKKQLPGITSQEQMYLLSLSDTVASTDYDLEGGVNEITSIKPEGKSVLKPT